jgi:MFS family permease
MNSPEPTPGRGLATTLRIFLPFAAGFFFSYLVRNVNAVIAPDLTLDLSLTAGTLGLLTSAYFLTFAAFQLPLGLLLDRFGPRIIDSILLIIAGVGCAWFAYGEDVTDLVVARALIGLGVSACLMASFKAFVMWFPVERLPLINGCVLAVGGIGALAATAPIEALLVHTDWRGIYLITGAFGIATALILFLVVPKHPSESEPATETLAEQIAGLGQIMRSRTFWRMTPVAALCNGTLLAMQGLWAGPWLKDVAGLDRQGVAFALAAIPPAMVAGFFLTGLIAERAASRGFEAHRVASMGIIIFLLVQLGIIFNVPLPPILLWCLFGFFATWSLVYYAVLTAHFGAAMAGRVNTAMNVFSFGYAFAAQWALGAIIGLFPGDEPGTYRVEGYQLAFAAAHVVQAMCFFWYAFARDDDD